MESELLFVVSCMGIVLAALTPIFAPDLKYFMLLFIGSGYAAFCALIVDIHQERCDKLHRIFLKLKLHDELLNQLQAAGSHPCPFRSESREGWSSDGSAPEEASETLPEIDLVPDNSTSDDESTSSSE